jgi:hypothetical protein
VPHFEVVEVAQFDIPLANAFHPGGGRPAAKPVDKLPHGRLFALDVQVNPAIGAIANPASYAELESLVTSPSAEEYALNPARYAEMPRDKRHHTTLISGASSAFIPTTL